MRRFLITVLCVITVGCAGVNKSCSQFSAESFGSDWIVVQYATDGRPFHCWKLNNVSLESEQGGGINWKETGLNAHLVHLTGWENRVQVWNRDYAGAAKIVGVDADRCESGVYPAPVK